MNNWFHIWSAYQHYVRKSMEVAMIDNDFDQYQSGCLDTAIYPDVGKNPIYPVLELAGELGKVTNVVLEKVPTEHQLDPLVHVLRLIVRVGNIAERVKEVMRNENLMISRWKSDAINGACFAASNSLSQIFNNLNYGWEKMQPIWRDIDISLCHETISDESGDMLYGVATLCREADVKLGDCAWQNQLKLAD